jgi:hypothetical protein
MTNLDTYADRDLVGQHEHLGKIRFLKTLNIFTFLIFFFFVYYNIIGDGVNSLLKQANCIVSQMGGVDGERNISSYPEYEVDKLYREEHKRVDNDDENLRCERYGLTVYNGTKPRRIFFGATVANEIWEMFLIHAIEVYDVYHMAVFVDLPTFPANHILGK